ncbi:hypothetical protein BDD14_4345 [Edaphobacter modestus]|uniref:Uncharacterized protein n=1 Tax=Edaphobacter modestus TaxID=388466 RepID=A0A4Q7YY84_9BACT|nr:hypothetical protein BDD14_4345 [Edaphobacter modestus]
MYLRYYRASSGFTAPLCLNLITATTIPRGTFRPLPRPGNGVCSVSGRFTSSSGLSSSS